MAACPSCGAENRDGARFCDACGGPLPEVALTLEVRKTVTVVFCDVIGSTALGERLDPEALRRVMSRYFAAMTDAIERHGGTVEKFIGDAVMAVFGIPTTHEDDALRAVRAAADMREALGLLNKELERDHGATLECRIGINTGEVVAGDASARQALVTGDAVNVAARLEQAAPPGDILIAGSTLRLVRDAVVAEEVEPLELKGKAEPVVAHRLVAVHAGAAGVARRLDSPLVGRERQLAQLHQAFDEVDADRVCHLFTILGAPGVGKSRLVQEALAGLGDRATILTGRCLSYGEGITYWPLADVVRDAIGPQDPGADLGRAIAALITDDQQAPEVASRVAQLAGGAIEISIPAEEIGWAVRRFFEALARTRPLVVVLDDLQWAEPSFLDLVDQVSDWSRDAPILLLCMARPELLDLRSDWGGGKLHASIAALEPLSPGESERLVANLLGDGTLDEESSGRILQAAEGNPLFVEETIAMLVDDGLLRHEGDRWTAAGNLEDVSVPPTIQALLAARLDRLGDAERAVLGRASVIGQVFYLRAVRELAPEDGEAETTSQVQQLVRRDLVRPEASDLPGEDAFRFHHGLLRDAAYQMLPKELRADLHERFADWLEEQPATPDADEFVGYHLEQAHSYRTELGPQDERSLALAERAAERLSAAADRAFGRADHSAIMNLSRRAAALRPAGDVRRAWDLMRLGWSSADRDAANEGSGAFEEALRIAVAVGDERAQAHASLGATYMSWLLDPEGGAEAMARLTEQLVPRLESWKDERGLAIAYICRSQVHWNACRFELARKDSARALPHAIAAGAGTFQRAAMATRVVAGLLGPASVDQIREDISELESRVASLPSLMPFVKEIGGSVAALVGEFDEARRLTAMAEDDRRELAEGSPGGAFESLWRIETLAENPAAAEEEIGKGYDVLHSSGDLAHASTAAVFRAISCFDLGRFDDARRFAQESRETSASDDAINQYMWRAVEAKLLAREGRLGDAEALIRDAVEWTERTDEFMGRSYVCHAEADLSLMAGRPGDARAALQRALELAEHKGATVLIEKAGHRLAELDAQ